MLPEEKEEDDDDDADGDGAHGYDGCSHDDCHFDGLGYDGQIDADPACFVLLCDVRSGNNFLSNKH